MIKVSGKLLAINLCGIACDYLIRLIVPTTFLLSGIP